VVPAVFEESGSLCCRVKDVMQCNVSKSQPSSLNTYTINCGVKLGQATAFKADL